MVRTEWTVDMLDALPDDGNRYERRAATGVPPPDVRWSRLRLTLGRAACESPE
ncbi:MAG TPA: hypothetical protein VH277_17055 [Gemmatimonadaceae bacterium]|nr:hypothetical protein [Gemmatimonadaceae bacterium]